MKHDKFTGDQTLTDNTEIEEVSALDVREGWLIGLLETYKR